MILQALNDYYHRLKNDQDINIPLLGFSEQKIHFVLLLDRQGNLLQVLPLGKKEGKKLTPKLLIVPEPVKRTLGIAPNFMWDNTAYVLGRDKKDKPERAISAFNAFKKHHHTLGDELDDEGMKAVLKFLDSWTPENSEKLDHWDEIAGMNVVFQLDGEMRYIHERPKIHEIWKEYVTEQGSKVFATCLVSGEKSPVARLHPDIKGIQGAQTKGAALVSFNLNAFLSYGKDQNFNAPVSEKIAFSYTTALNYLLSVNSRQKIRIGDTTTVFWTEKTSPIEFFMGHLLNPDEVEQVEDSGQLQQIRLFLEAVRDGKHPRDIDHEIKFFILGLSPNAARLSVRFWHVSTVGDVSAKIGQHYKDLSIEKSYKNDPEFPGVWRLLRETAAQRKTENISPQLIGAMMRAILTGAAYPQSLLVSVINRLRADQTVNYLRAALIKAHLVRKFRMNNYYPMEVGMTLNQEATNVAYRLGRLFAALEKAQMDAVPGAGSTIKDRFYGTASASPRIVFPQLIRLAQHHIKKAEYGFMSDKLIEEIMQGIEEFPTHLSLDDQGLFALGYYHQRRAIFTKTEETTEDKKED
ncbi:MAG: type I-C CRISPR-associated protein Cas8c/Csd1 [Deltaproteobacteria bacterium]|nr:type I-C CRISPR-associated protein Cas8c/Csd1 [Deltaproteobacteria bacterium]